jgi:hypothetical protein
LTWLKNCDPSALEVELPDLAYQAENGDVYCSTMGSVLVPEPEKDPAWDGADFFDLWKTMKMTKPCQQVLITQVQKRNPLSPQWRNSKFAI